MESTNGLQVKGLQKNQLLSPREFILRYLKYLPWIVLSLAVALIIAKIKLRYSIPIYRTESTLLIKREATPRGNNEKFDEIFAGSNFQNVYNEMELLRSRPLAARVAKRLNLQSSCINKGNIRSTLLYKAEMPLELELLPPADSTATMAVEVTVTDNNHFKLADDPKQYVFGEPIQSRGQTFRVVKKRPQVFNLYASNIYILSKSDLAQATETVVGGLNVSLADNFAQIINLRYESQNPAMAEDILNTLMDVYRESNIEDKRQMRISTLEFIDERLDSIRIELGIVEKDLTKFIESNRAIELEKQSELYLGRINQESINQSQQEVKLSIVDFLIRYLSKPENAYRAVPVDLGTQEPTLIPLITQYNQLQLERQNALVTMPAANPFVQNLDSRLTKLREDIIEALQNVRQSYLIAASSIQRQSGESERKLQSIPSKALQLTDRERQRKIKEELYLFLLQKKEETAIASASTISDSKVVEPARANYSPIRPNRRSTYMVSILIGLAIPIGLLTLKEYLNDKVGGRADIEKVSDVPYLGEVGHSDQKEALVVTRHSRRVISEQFRIIRTNLQFLLSNVNKPVILVTSSFSGEGKSFITTNIGAVMALTGKKTVILEFDIRKPKIVSNLELKKHAGITNYIVGKARLDELVLPVSDMDNLYVIPCGPVPPNPAEMLLEPKIKELFDYLKVRFDVVIVDSAPVGLVSDAMILGEHADCTLYILRQNYTYKKQLGLIDELYTQKKLPKLSVLLNDVKAGTGGYGSYGGYGGYGYGYGYGYGSGYFDESKAKKKTIWQRVQGLFS
ncbi:MAG TPA: polysaccharide biosynthesis tyrosine autokinase [Chitinophagaceae bacterium]|nr:polysaccharide biosynthesis tyrosine autokinase [Chitinophagaceae bacterium]